MTSFELPEVDRITVGTEGEPGQRVFYLQARMGVQLVTLKVEKQQVAALAEYLGTLLADLPRPGELPTDLDLEEPALPEWAVGTLQVSYDPETDRVLIVAEELLVVDEDDDEVPARVPGIARFGTTREQVAAIAIRGTSLVQAGRPPCPLCGHPLDPEGHACPRTNGHRPPGR
jgi:uncharacterized repeat protein (TIGR03847 family)